MAFGALSVRSSGNGMQPSGRHVYLREWVAGVTVVTRGPLSAGAQFYMVEGRWLGKIRMLRLINLDKRWSGRSCAIVVLLAVFSLTVSVATRYCSSQSSSAYSVRSVHEHSSPERSRQHLTKSAADWIPPVVRAGVLEAPTSYPRIAPAGPPMPSFLLEKSLYNRPPPSC
jgi:hypothetical protein